MDRNSIIGIVIIAVIFVVFSIVNKKPAEQLAEEKRINDSIRKVEEIAQREAELEKLKKELNQPVATENAVEMTPVAEVKVKVDTVDYRKIILENDLIRVVLSEKGGRPVSVELKDYMRYDSVPVRLFDEDSSKFGMQYSWNNRPRNTGDFYFQALTKSNDLNAENDTQTVIMRYNRDEANYIEYRYSLAPGRYLLNMEIEFVGMKDISTPLGSIDLNWMINSPQQERGRDNEMIYTTLYYKPLGDDVDFFRMRTKKAVQEESFPTSLEWIAYKDQFFSSVIIARDAFLDANMQSEIKSKSSKYLKKFESRISLPFEKTGNYTTGVDFYFGPNKYKLLKNKYGEKRLYDLVTVGKGIIKWINQIVIATIES